MTSPSRHAADAIRLHDARKTRANRVKGAASMHAVAIGGTRYSFPDLKGLLAKASPARSGDRLAGVAAATAAERVAAQLALADLPLATFLNEVVVPYEDDE